MNNERDYLEWWNYHASVVSSVASWVDSRDDPDVVHSAWMQAMDGVRLEDAIAGTNAIVSGAIERPFPEETPAVIRRYAAELALSRRPRREPESTGHSCELCRETGFVTIWHLLIARAVIQGARQFKSPSGEIFKAYNADGSLKNLTAVAPCKCRLGDRFSTKMVKHGEKWVQEDVRRYDPSNFHCAIQFRTCDEKSHMSVQEQVEADLTTANFSLPQDDWEIP